MKLNKKGFTLIELLAVVVILLAISVIAISSISAAIERNKNKQNETKIGLIEDMARLYYNENKNNLNQSGCILLSNREFLLYLSDSKNDTNVTDDSIDYSAIEDADGNRFSGGVRYTNGANFVYDENCN